MFQDLEGIFKIEKCIQAVARGILDLVLAVNQLRQFRVSSNLLRKSFQPLQEVRS